MATTVATHGAQAGTLTAATESNEQQVVNIVRELALELTGERAARAAGPAASLERDIGLSSLDRVELMTRLESLFQRELDDSFLLLDTPREIAREIERAPRARRPTPARAAPAAATTVRLDDVATLVDALARRAAAEPLRVHVHLHEDVTTPLTYAALWDGARRIAAGLAARGISRGDTVAIMLPTGVDYLQVFMGVLAAGAVAVPLYPPARLDRMQEYLARQSRILANAEARIMVTIPEAAAVARMLRDGAAVLREIVTADDLRAASEPEDLPAVAPADFALVQYTSGSTGEPKGVLLSHANLLANISAISAGVDIRPTDVVVSWLPLYHDMGLIGSWLTALVHGIPMVLMSPLAFLARPEKWLWAIHERRATLSAAPNFAYELCVRKVPDEAIQGLDLSSWRCAANGSEAVSAATLDRFARRYERYGFRRSALMPVYGLAENSVALAFPPIDREPRLDRIVREPFVREHRAVPAPPGDSHPLVFASVGTALQAHEIRVVGDDGAVVPDRTEGRVQFRGPSAMSCYLRNPDATAETVRADGWLESGDFGYIAGGELYVTGRAKDLIIKGGRNLVPAEIEEVAGSVDGIRKGCVAAFGVPDEASGTERFVVLAESRARTRDEHERLEQAVVSRVAVAIGVPPDIVRIVPPGSVPKTPSGKIRRSAAREAWENGTIAGKRSIPLRLRAALLAGFIGAKARAAIGRTGRVLELAALGAAWTLALAVLGPIALVLLYVLPEGRPIRALSRFVSRTLLAISRSPIRLEGRERLPSSGPMVLVANHASYADTPVLLAALPIDFVFVAMKEILTWRVIGTITRRGRHLLVDRWHLRQSLEDAGAIERRLRAGDAILVFAEGGFTRASGLRPFRMGAFEAAVAAGAPVVPIALRGTRQLLPADSRLPHPRQVDVWIGEPLRTGEAGWKGALDLRERAAEAVAEHCGEPRRDA